MNINTNKFASFKLLYCTYLYCLQILPHPQFDELIKLCQASFEVPHWWVPDTHDRDLLKGVAK